jgi:hypothetical protein
VPIAARTAPTIAAGCRRCHEPPIAVRAGKGYPADHPSVYTFIQITECLVRGRSRRATLALAVSGHGPVVSSIADVPCRFAVQRWPPEPQVGSDAAPLRCAVTADGGYVISGVISGSRSRLTHGGAREGSRGCRDCGSVDLPGLSFGKPEEKMVFGGADLVLRPAPTSTRTGLVGAKRWGRQIAFSAGGSGRRLGIGAVATGAGAARNGRRDRVARFCARRGRRRPRDRSRRGPFAAIHGQHHARRPASRSWCHRLGADGTCLCSAGVRRRPVRPRLPSRAITLRDAKIMRKFSGTNQSQRLVIAGADGQVATLWSRRSKAATLLAGIRRLLTGNSCQGIAHDQGGGGGRPTIPECTTCRQRANAVEQLAGGGRDRRCGGMDPWCCASLIYI